MDILNKLTCNSSQIKTTLKFFRFSTQFNSHSRNINSNRINGLKLVLVKSLHSIIGCSRRDMASVHKKGCKLRLFHIVGDDVGLGDHKISRSEKTEKVEGLAGVLLKSAACLLKGGVIAVPTDTIYGVACMAQSSEAIKRIYEIKNRNFQNPIAISVSTIDDIYKWCKVTVERMLLTELLPGAVTVVFQRSLDLNPLLNPHTSLVGVRIPNHSFMQALAKECDGPIALTSANISGAKSCLRIEEFEHLWPKIDLVVDGGTLSDSEESRLGSTVVDLSVPETFRIIRPGSALQATLQILEKYGLKEVKLEDNISCAR
ncbi:unnamed protein product [Lymnaea stagnalis]|uniref:Threonylcarbamoyl-AMP synthase n=1 Tax=Lymnaea stagnalis TaxID=6523 RepID=A0AAV2HG21_LYMST